MDKPIRTKVLIVGTGGNGISPAVYFKRAGITDFTIISKHADFGGTWYQNTYPGCEVDVPSVLYQLGHAVTGDWSATYAKQPELLSYLQTVARDNDLYPHTHFNTEMTGAQWSEREVCWEVDTSNGRYHAQFLLLATGYLEEAIIPPIPGLDTFTGKMFHSTDWPDGYDGAGERIAVVGTGSSGMQIVTEMQKTAAEVVVFQRTPMWVRPKHNKKLSPADKVDMYRAAQLAADHRGEDFETREKGWLETLLGRHRDTNEDEAARFLEQEVADPRLRQLLTPDYDFGCKRTLYSDDYYAAVQQHNVRLIPEGAAEVGRDSITAQSGTRIDIDTIVLATGFYFGGHILSTIIRRDGRTIAEVQDGHPRAYKSVSVAGCPNLFLIGGPAPNGQIWHGMYAGEITAKYILQVMAYMDEHGIRALEVGEDAEIGWKQETDRILDAGPTVSGGCVNYSQDAAGHNKAAWPGTLRQMDATLEVFDATAYRAVDATAAHGSPPPRLSMQYSTKSKGNSHERSVHLHG